MRRIEALVVIALLIGGLFLASLSQAANLKEEPGSPDSNVTEIVLDSGRYVIVTPGAQTGEEPYPTLFYYHGYGQSADLVLKNKALLNLASSRGVMLVIPDGLNRSWSNVGAPSERRDEIAFTRDILRDVKSRHEVDEERSWVSGFSQGGSMAWDVACYMGEEFSAFFPIAGSFWRPHPVACDEPVNMRHIHGLSDRVVPMTGRPIGERWHQGDVKIGVGIWKETNRCEANPETVILPDMTCEVWRGCATGKELELCLHSGGHNIKMKWLAQGMDWAEGLKNVTVSEENL
ncbi:alpha/beta hydrolase family esterase [Kiloniella litopenaei]|uniref:alpha/beta hydrolase family esterase n=1 Tax=Kiloniella litopenaei TaxID=1549748 RepID=UPI003BAA70E7